MREEMGIKRIVKERKKIKTEQAGREEKYKRTILGLIFSAILNILCKTSALYCEGEFFVVISCNVNKEIDC